MEVRACSERGADVGCALTGLVPPSSRAARLSSSLIYPPAFSSRSPVTAQPPNDAPTRNLSPSPRSHLASAAIQSAVVRGLFGISSIFSADFILGSKFSLELV